MGAAQSGESVTNEEASQRPKTSRTTSDNDVPSEDSLKKVKLDDLFQSASPKHSPVITEQHSRIDTYAGLPPLPIMELHRMSTMKVNSERGPSHVSKAPSSISALSDCPEVIPYIKRRSLIYAAKPGLSTRSCNKSTQMTLHVVPEVLAHLPLSNHNGLNGISPNELESSRASTPALPNLCLGAFRSGTLHVVNGDSTPPDPTSPVGSSESLSLKASLSSYLDPSPASLLTRIQVKISKEDMEKSTTQTSRLREKRSGDIMLEIRGVQQQPARFQSSLKTTEDAVFDTEEAVRHRNPSHTHEVYRSRKTGGIEVVAISPDLAFDSRSTSTDIKRRLSNRSDITSKSYASGRSTVSRESTVSSATDITDFIDECQHKSTLASNAVKISGAAAVEQFETTCLDESSTINHGLALVADRSKPYWQSENDHLSTVAARHRPLGKAPEDLVVEPAFWVEPLSTETTDSRQYQVRLLKPKSLTEMLIVSSGHANRSVPLKPTTRRSPHMTRAAASSNNSHYPTSPARYEPFTPVSPGSPGSNVKVYHAPSYYSEKMKLDNPDLVMALQQPRPIGAYKAAQIMHDGAMKREHDKVCAAPRSPLGPRPMTGATMPQSPSKDSIIAGIRSQARNLTARHESGSIVKSEIILM